MNADAAEVRRRRLRKQLAEVVTWLETGEERPEVFGSTDEYEWLLRLTGVVASLLARHRVDGRRRCEWCQQRRHGWRRLVPRWTNRTACQVVSVAWSYATSELAVVWWQVFNLTGEKISLDGVRDWLSAEDQPEDEPDTEPQHTPREGRHALSDDLLAGLRATTAEPTQHVRPYVSRATPTVQFSRQPSDRPEAETEELPKINKP
jgi:hypothetical protein